MEWILVKTLLSLAAVIALMVGMVYVLKRYVYRSGASGSSIVDVNVLGQRSLQPKRSVVVVKVMNKVLIVGMSEQGMQPLAEITDKTSLAQIEERLEARPSESRWITWRKETVPGASTGGSFTGHWQRAIQNFVQGRPAGDQDSGSLGWEAVKRPNGRRSKTPRK